jgi:hypothetical protein
MSRHSCPTACSTPPYFGERDRGTIDAAEVRPTEDEISEFAPPPYRKEPPIYAVLGPDRQGRRSKSSGTQKNHSGAHSSGCCPTVDAGMRCDYSFFGRASKEGDFMALAERRVSVDSSWLHNPAVRKHFPFVLGIGAIFRQRIQSSEDYFPSGRSLHSTVTRLANLGAIANLGHLREYKDESDLPRTISLSSCKEVT